MDFSDISNLAYILPEWHRVVERDYNHPAIIGWCPLNETWQFGSNEAFQNDDFIRIIYDTTKLIDKTRPVIDTSGGYHVKTDIYDVHDYEQNPAVFREHYDMLYREGVLFDNLNNMFSKKETWRGEPVFMSEYGGTGFSLEDGGWGYGNTVRSAEEFYERYKGLTDAMLDNPRIFGFCYTQLTDVELEMNGLYTFVDRAPKHDMSIIRGINTRKAAVEE